MFVTNSKTNMQSYYWNSCTHCIKRTVMCLTSKNMISVLSEHVPYVAQVPDYLTKKSYTIFTVNYVQLLSCIQSHSQQLNPFNHVFYHPGFTGDRGRKITSNIWDFQSVHNTLRVHVLLMSQLYLIQFIKTWNTYYRCLKAILQNCQTSNCRTLTA